MNVMEKPQHTSKKHTDLGQLPECPDSVGSTGKISFLWVFKNKMFSWTQIEDIDVVGGVGQFRKPSKFAPSLQDNYGSSALSNSMFYKESLVRL